MTEPQIIVQPMGTRRGSNAALDKTRRHSSALPVGLSSPFVSALASFNLVVGVGVLYLPGAFQKSGVLLATIMCAVVSLMCYYTSCMIVQIGQRINKWSYEELCLELLGRPGYYILAVSCVMFNWAAALVYFMSIHEMLTPVLMRWCDIDSENLFGGIEGKEQLLTILLTMPVLLPLSLFKDLSALRFVSMLKAVVMGCTMITVLVLGCTHMVHNYQKLSTWDLTSENSQLAIFLEDLVETGVESIHAEWHPETKKAVEAIAARQLTDSEGLGEHSAAEWEAMKDEAKRGTPTGEMWQHISQAFATDAESWQQAGNGFPVVTRALYDTPPASDANPADRLHYHLETYGAPKPKTADAFAQLSQRNNPDAQRAQPSVGERFSTPVPYLFNTGFPTCIGTLIFSFVFHDSIFSVVKTLKRPNLAGWRVSSKIALGMIFGAQVIFSVFVAMLFGTEIPDNVLTADAKSLPVFPLRDTLTGVLQFAFSIVLMLTYPAVLVLSREYIESVIILLRTPKTANDTVDLTGSGVSRHASSLISVLLVASTIPFIFAPDVGEMASSIMDIFGALACGTMAFILPTLCYYGVHGFQAKKHEVLPMLILIVGVLIVVVCPTLQTLELAGVISLEGELPPQAAITA